MHQLRCEWCHRFSHAQVTFESQNCMQAGHALRIRKTFNLLAVNVSTCTLLLDICSQKRAAESSGTLPRDEQNRSELHRAGV